MKFSFVGPGPGVEVELTTANARIIYFNQLTEQLLKEKWRYQ